MRKLLIKYTEVLESGDKDLFGPAFTKKLVKSIKDEKQLKKSLEREGHHHKKGKKHFCQDLLPTIGEGSTLSEEPPQRKYQLWGPWQGVWPRWRWRQSQVRTNYLLYSKKTLLPQKQFVRSQGVSKEINGSERITYSPQGSGSSKSARPVYDRRTLGPSWAAEDLHPELAGHNSGPVDFGCSVRSPHRLGGNPNTRPSTKRAWIQSRDQPQGRPRDIKNVEVRSNRENLKLRPSVYQHTFSEGQKRQGKSPDLQPKELQQVHTLPTLQARMDPSPDRHNSTGGLYVQNRPEECILVSASASDR